MIKSMLRSIRFLKTDKDLLAFIAIVAYIECDGNESHAIRKLLREAREYRRAAGKKGVDNDNS